MTPIPKPARRPPAARHAIRRSAWPRRARVGRGNALSEWKLAVSDADDAWRDAVHEIRVRATGGRCDCGCWRRVSMEGIVWQHHHLFVRNLWPTRWVVENGALLSKGCHQRIHSDQDEWRELAIRLMGGVGGYEMFRMLAHSPRKVDPALAIVALRARLDELRGTR